MDILDHMAQELKAEGKQDEKVLDKMSNTVAHWNKKSYITKIKKNIRKAVA